MKRLRYFYTQGNKIVFSFFTCLHARVLGTCFARLIMISVRWFKIEVSVNGRVKRGRGAVGSRMDEAGPYLAPSADSNGKLSASYDVWQHRVFGPEKPPSLKPCRSSDDDDDADRRKKRKERSSSSEKKHSKKRKSKEKSRHKKKKREGKRSKHR